MFSHYRGVCAALGGSLVLTLVFGAGAQAFEPNWGTPMPIPPSMPSVFWDDYDKLGPQPEPPDLPVYYRIPGQDEMKISPQPEPPSQPADRFELILFKMFGF